MNEIELKKMWWHSRRGMLELDLLLLPFYDEVFADLDSSEQQAFIKLLEQEDPDLLQWFARQGVSEDPALQSLVEKILDRVQP